jgi:hypothetical protein
VRECLLGDLRCDLSREINRSRIGLVCCKTQHRDLNCVRPVTGGELDRAAAHETHAITRRHQGNNVAGFHLRHRRQFGCSRP